MISSNLELPWQNLAFFDFRESSDCPLDRYCKESSVRCKSWGITVWVPRNWSEETSIVPTELLESCFLTVHPLPVSNGTIGARGTLLIPLSDLLFGRSIWNRKKTSSTKSLKRKLFFKREFHHRDLQRSFHLTYFSFPKRTS